MSAINLLLFIYCVFIIVSIYQETSLISIPMTYWIYTSSLAFYVKILLYPCQKYPFFLKGFALQLILATYMGNSLFSQVLIFFVLWSSLLKVKALFLINFSYYLHNLIYGHTYIYIGADLHIGRGTGTVPVSPLYFITM